MADTLSTLSAKDSGYPKVYGYGSREAHLAKLVKTYVDSVSPETLITTRGDLIRGIASGVAARYALGTAGKVLVSDGTDLVWSILDGAVTLADGKVLVGNGSNLGVAVTPSGDVTMTNAGVMAIAAGAIVDADVNGSAAIAYSKLNLATSIVDADVSASAAIAGSKLVAATNLVAGAVSTGAQAFAGLKTFHDGVKVDDDVDQDTLAYYRADTKASTFTWDGTGGTSGSITMQITRVGRLVNLFIPAPTATTGTSSTDLVANTALDAWATPAAEAWTACEIIDQATRTIGSVFVTAAGVVHIKKPGGATFANSQTSGAYGNITVSYYTNN